METEDLVDQLSANKEIIGQTFTDGIGPSHDMNAAVFRDCTFERIQFSDSLLEDATFETCHFKACSFHGTVLKYAEFEDCNFFDSDTGAGADFTYAEMSAAKFMRCNLSTSIFRGANLFEAQFEDCMAQGANFETASFSLVIRSRKRNTSTDITLKNCNFDYTILLDISLAGASITGCSLRQSNLAGCDFTGADLSNSDLAGAETSKACFEGADLRGAKLDGMLLGTLTSFRNMRIDESQQTNLLAGLGIQVFP